MGQYNYRTSPVNSIMGNNWGQPTGLLGSGSYGVPALNQGSEMFSQPVVPQDWAAQTMQGINGSGFNSGALAMGNTRELPAGNWWDGATGPNGWGDLALGAAGGLASAFLGMKQYGLAKQTLAENKRQFQMNYDAQKKTMNTRMEDRQAALVARNPGAYESVGSYMDRNRVA